MQKWMWHKKWNDKRQFPNVRIKLYLQPWSKRFRDISSNLRPPTPPPHQPRLHRFCDIKSIPSFFMLRKSNPQEVCLPSPRATAYERPASVPSANRNPRALNSPQAREASQSAWRRWFAARRGTQGTNQRPEITGGWPGWPPSLGYKSVKLPWGWWEYGYYKCWLWWATQWAY